jgi:alpha-glucosidase
MKDPIDMTQRRRYLPAIVVSLLSLAFKAYASDEVRSPGGSLVIRFELSDVGQPTYEVDFQGRPVILKSALGLEPELTSGFRAAGTSASSHHGQWSQVYGERKVVPDNYNELAVDLKHSTGRTVRLVFRAYDEGAALCYSISDTAADLQLTGERTEFHFPANTYGYEEHSTEGDYTRSLVKDIQPQCERPLTLELERGLFAAIAEADNQRYPRMLLGPLSNSPNSLVSELGGTTSNTVGRGGLSYDGQNGRVTLKAGMSTPWRVIMVGERPGDLLEHNYLILNLNPPLALADTDWIEPGKCMRDTTLTTANSKAIIDFAAASGLEYVELDDGWYGTIDAKTGDATAARKPNLDIEEIVRYGREKKVGLILYVDWRQANRQRDELFALYEKWGVKGLKLGFVPVGSQADTTWITETIQKAAEHHLMLNIHDGYRPTGYSRTYSNLMTVEGVQGNEHMPTAAHNCTLPFTRYIAGPADYTVCYYDRRIKTTHAHQMAMAVVSYSPLQWIFWYDKPSMYSGEPEMEFFKRIPTVWDDTKVINGKIGQHATIARRSGEDWFIGAINGPDPRTLEVPFNFLEAGKNYTAHIYADDESAPTKTKVTVKTRPVTSITVLDVPLEASGGQVIWISAKEP